VRDPSLRARALDLAASLDGRSVLTLLSRALADDENRAAAFDYVRSRVGALEAKLPKDTMASLLEPMGRLCTAAHREAFERAFAARAPGYMTGEQKFNQALESIDLCLSARR
jgi:hypothetical protein